MAAPCNTLTSDCFAVVMIIIIIMIWKIHIRLGAWLGSIFFILRLLSSSVLRRAMNIGENMKMINVKSMWNICKNQTLWKPHLTSYGNWPLPSLQCYLKKSVIVMVSCFIWWKWVLGPGYMLGRSGNGEGVSMKKSVSAK